MIYDKYIHPYLDLYIFELFIKYVFQLVLVVSEMMKAAGCFGSRWMTDLINNIVKEGCIPDDWRKSILYLCTMGKVIQLCVGHTEL